MLLTVYCAMILVAILGWSVMHRRNGAAFAHPVPLQLASQNRDFQAAARTKQWMSKFGRARFFPRPYRFQKVVPRPRAGITPAGSAANREAKPALASCLCVRASF
jgi:hypothetical protein